MNESWKWLSWDSIQIICVFVFLTNHIFKSYKNLRWSLLMVKLEHQGNTLRWSFIFITSRPVGTGRYLFTDSSSSFWSRNPNSKRELTTKFQISLKRCGLETVRGRGQGLYSFIFCYHLWVPTIHTDSFLQKLQFSFKRQITAPSKRRNVLFLKVNSHFLLKLLNFMKGSAR